MLKIITKNINEIKQYENNAKMHTQSQINQIKKSIEKFGFNDPIAIDENNMIIEGHGRYKAIKELGHETCECIVLNNLTEEQKRAYMLVHNKLTLNTQFDIFRLNQELDKIKFIDMSDFDFDFKIDDIMKNDNIDNYDGEITNTPKSKERQTWKLGTHRLFCGDSTNKENIEKLLNGEKMDLVFTDPPYDLYKNGRGVHSEIASHTRRLYENLDFISEFDPSEFLENMKSCFKGNYTNSYIFCNKKLIPRYLNWAEENKINFNILVWKKPNPMPLGGQHRPDIEYLLYFSKNAIWNNGIKNVKYSKCLEFDRVKGKHPTMKPVELIENELKISSNEGSNVIDFYGGSGSTLIACEKQKRKCFMFEKLPQYVDYIIERWENLTGQKAELLEE